MPVWVVDNVNDQVIDDSGNWVYCSDYPTLTADTISFADTDPDTILDSNNGFVTAGFIPGTRLIVSGSGSNDGAYTVDTVAPGSMTLIATDELAVEAAGATVTLSEIDVKVDNHPPAINADQTFHGLQTQKISNRYDIPIDNDACVASIAPDTNYGNNVTLGVRYDSVGTEYVYVYMKADLSKFSSGHILDKGYLFIKRIYGVGTEQISSLNLTRVLDADWSEGTITWNTKPGTANSKTINIQNIRQDSWVIIDIKDWLQNWIDGVWNNYGLVLRPNDDTPIKRFRSSEYATVADRPFFSLFYFPYD
jgi:hypothetical protein